MSEHTRGPWNVVEGHYPGFLEVSGPSFKISIVTSATDIDFNDYASRIADAKLIAAAPDLFEACKYFMDYYDRDFDDGMDMMLSYEKSVKAIRAAIAKAKGEN